MKNINFFVYGSLREGFFNYDKYLKGKVVSIKPAKLENKIVYDMPYKGYPAIMEGNGTVYGEIMEVIPDIYEEVMEAMDIMEGFKGEGNSENEYHKTLLEAVHLFDETKEECFVYYYNPSIDDRFEKEAVFIEDGDWAAYKTI